MNPLWSRRWLAGAIGCFGVAVLIWGVWEGSLHLWDEALTAERAREMVVTGDWLTPHFQFLPDYNKPPLIYWLVALLFRVFGQDELLVRLPSVLCAIATLELVRRAARDAAGPEAGLWAMGLLATNPHWVNQARQGLLDTALALALVVAIWRLAGRPVGAIRQRDSWIAGIALGLGCLVKSPLILLALIPVAVAMPRRARSRPVGALAIAVGCAAPWYFYQFAAHGAEFTEQFFLTEHAGHLVGDLGLAGRPFYTIPAAWLRLAPFSFAALLAALLEVGCGRRRPAARLGIWWMSGGLILLGLMAMATKRPGYLEILYPIAAIVAGAGAVRLRRRLRPPRRRARWAWSALGMLALAGFATGYNPRVDGAGHDKAMGRRILAEEGAGRLFYAYNRPVNSMLFYSRGRARATGPDMLTGHVAGWLRQPDRPMLIVAFASDVDEVRRHALAAGAPAPRMGAREGDLCLFRIAPPAESP